ncbi:hypothetical protein K0M31_007724 [Melipona bicolor]|uniref:Uncharacterized protein n=1 Tax=Melipona bicolor TaxID=60889 RepID=A0AA40GCA7_9HYME|nr:hypothetical protein K0M31_007724 [Melipona bicolor]
MCVCVCVCVCDTKSYANRRTGTHTVDITESVYTHSVHTRQRAHARQKRDRLYEGSERDGQGGSKQDRCWPQQPLTRQYYFQPFSGANATRRGVVSQPSSQS